jgi:hypothetical protein
MAEGLFQIRTRSGEYLVDHVPRAEIVVRRCRQSETTRSNSAKSGSIETEKRTLGDCLAEAATLTSTHEVRHANGEYLALA